MPESTSGNVPSRAGPTWWDRAISGLVPAALIAAMIAYAFPFIVPRPGFHSFSPESGLSNFFLGFYFLILAPLHPFFATFSLPLMVAAIGLLYQRRPGWIGSLAPLICAVVGLTCLGSAYLWDRSEHFAYGYFAVEASFLVAAVASAVRLIRLRRDRVMWDAKAEPRDEPAASAQQELLARYRKKR